MFSLRCGRETLNGENPRYQVGTENPINMQSSGLRLHTNQGPQRWKARKETTEQTWSQTDTDKSFDLLFTFTELNKTLKTLNAGLAELRLTSFLLRLKINDKKKQHCVSNCSLFAYHSQSIKHKLWGESKELGQISWFCFNTESKESVLTEAGNSALISSIFHWLAGNFCL